MLSCSIPHSAWSAESVYIRLVFMERIYSTSHHRIVEMVKIITSTAAEAVINNTKDRAESTGSKDFVETTENAYRLA
jgi:hypothetical protein